MGDVLCDFVEVESDGYTRRMLLDVVSEAVSHRVVRDLTLDVFNRTIDGESDASRSEESRSKPSSRRSEGGDGADA
ncbi:hypothetical protein [Rhodococcus sp. Q]|uniref:hypothetical protein n=1 Tax=Rhodococcus sp. Q TaxID=2502252 RepID=UPI0010F7C261|nr:hypothetical protein [Rhodococcus sp. Q]